MRRAVLLDTPQPLVELTMDKYILISSMKGSKQSFDNLKYRIYDAIPRLKPFSGAQIKDKIKYKESKMFFNAKPEEMLESEKGLKELSIFASNAPQYLYKNPYPYTISKKGKEWTIAEKKAFVKIYESCQEIDFSALALCFPGRSGSQIYNYYRHLMQEWIITEKQNSKQTMPFDIYMRRYFLAPTEKALAADITNLFLSGVQITEKLVREKTMYYYYLPHVLAERALYRSYIDQGKPVFTEEGNEYTRVFGRSPNNY